ncbi:hypothetical protein COW99_01735 [Candidatus Roizmanbacteria bacterium CG22_combo_CG10-13_8_21_14_all_38_20]|uniref:Polymerase beta nucleotidyltransferase domain-containing protein n=1 Tax=Candidatus Roizmanbacteria bacterium CG22_combo_CG10-13_8_21_14_all_38_20 TaxID=1974862 RepID=A0A2H0BW64_9BACT|nr:nucleotidyltransferase family protein [Candidatus Microgenomates bacterium]PIP61926.1 MAG: hypothetical protein COW99_01735 [Candidatus Roizmanbacteria bacterium CG22_combo_CG10-13_8_21_14_all_38_20]PJC32099.1 MAG: hypothetical protein CO050_01220 [Candidatus Roizmanbacteria bacterium CG_4_9_14_0_2_um_filter_38_17]
MQRSDLYNNTKDIFSHYGVKKAAVFGSYARGDNRDDSDIDILVELGRSMGLIDYSGLRLDLQDRLGMKVDLVQYKTIKPSIKEYILKDETVLFQA